MTRKVRILPELYALLCSQWAESAESALDSGGAETPASRCFFSAGVLSRHQSDPGGGLPVGSE